MVEHYFKEEPVAGTKNMGVDIRALKLKVKAVYRHNFSVMDDYPVSFPINWSDSINPDLTWRLCFNSLRWLEQYLNSRNTDSVLTAFRVIDDWIWAHTSYPVFNESYAFDDHGSTIRLEILGRAYSKYQDMKLNDQGFRQRLQLCLLSHIFFVTTLERYSCWHNHAILFDENLIGTLTGLSGFTLRDELLKFAFTRVAEQYRYSFTNEGVHKESSPCYHRQFTQTLGRLVTIASKSGIQFPSSMPELVGKAYEYKRYLDIQGISLPIGDCARKPVKAIKAPPLASGTFDYRLFPLSGWAFIFDTVNRLNIVAQSDFFSFSHY